MGVIGLSEKPSSRQSVTCPVKMRRICSGPSESTSEEGETNSANS